MTATAYYPAGNGTWTEAVMQDYGGSITWTAKVMNGTLTGTAAEQIREALKTYKDQVSAAWQA